MIFFQIQHFFLANNLGSPNKIGLHHNKCQANDLTAEYEQELSKVRKEAQLEITNSQKIHKEI